MCCCRQWHKQAALQLLLPPPPPGTRGAPLAGPSEPSGPTGPDQGRPSSGRDGRDGRPAGQLARASCRLRPGPCLEPHERRPTRALDYARNWPARRRHSDGRRPSAREIILSPLAMNTRPRFVAFLVKFGQISLTWIQLVVVGGVQEERERIPIQMIDRNDFAVGGNKQIVSIPHPE